MYAFKHWVLRCGYSTPNPSIATIGCANSCSIETTYPTELCIAWKEIHIKPIVICNIRGQSRALPILSIEILHETNADYQ